MKKSEKGSMFIDKKGQLKTTITIVLNSKKKEVKVDVKGVMQIAYEYVHENTIITYYERLLNWIVE